MKNRPHMTNIKGKKDMLSDPGISQKKQKISDLIGVQPF